MFRYMFTEITCKNHNRNRTFNVISKEHFKRRMWPLYVGLCSIPPVLIIPCLAACMLNLDSLNDSCCLGTVGDFVINLTKQWI